MHLLAARPGTINDGSQAVDLRQTPGDVIFLSAADTELALLASARTTIVEYPVLRLANLMRLGHNLSVDLYTEAIIANARLVIVRLLGGRGYWRYGVDQIAAVCRKRAIPVAFLPGDDQPDAELAEMTTLRPADSQRLWQYLVHGGAANARSFLGFAARLVGHDAEWCEPVPLLRSGLYWPNRQVYGLDALKTIWRDDAPVVALIFYRALMQAGNTHAVDKLIEALADSSLNPLPIFAQSLKEPVVAAMIAGTLEEVSPAVIVNTTGFAVSAPVSPRSATPFDGADCPVLQVVFSGGDLADWRDGTAGLSARDIAMNVALPEVDGRIFTRAVSFKGTSHRDPLTEADIVAHEPVADRAAFVAKLAARWAQLRARPASRRVVALVVANYPNRDGRLGNGVGLDTPAGTMNILAAMADAGYTIADLPADAQELIARMQSGPTNDFTALADRVVRETLAVQDYMSLFATVPVAVRDAVVARWGNPQDDPHVINGGFALSVFRLGNVIIGLQPARGYNIDPADSYHDPALVPPHSYFAFYLWLRHTANVDAIVHMGKHGNMEWLPGKSLALSEECFPEAVFGPLPHIYPFIVNDPGEGSQAKRRAQAVIIDHLTPPLTRAESYGPLRDLERLVDEYYEAAGVDPRRLKVLKKEILSLCQATGVGSDCGMADGEEDEEALRKLDNYLCELKELQIRDGLHVFGESPSGDLLVNLLVALLRVPRNGGDGQGASILRTLGADLKIDGDGFDPLDCEMAAPWTGLRPAALSDIHGALWRTAGDTVERLEYLARALVAGDVPCDPSWPATVAVLDGLLCDLRPSVEASGPGEIAGLLAALDGRFVAPGPSGAPTRGRPDVLPTGRNFYAVDTRTVPTPAAWTLGWKSASLLVETYRQDHGEWPKTVALSAWGTSNMRTGGDDIAQGLALMGVRPTWDSASRRVTGFEIMPADLLARPRVDVTLRVSGFFRDAFPALIDLFDSAARAVAGLDEEPTINPAAACREKEVAGLVASGIPPADAERLAGFRVFGSKPGAYGAGLQAMIDERGWCDDGDLAGVYIAWGSYAYGSGANGENARASFETRLRQTEAVIHNQDNREHDLLDSDDYYQFEGGMTAAVRTLSGSQPRIYHNDHSRPETPRIRTLENEIGRVVRARVVNPKWIRGVMRHGYKGGFEMAATVDYLFAFAATTRCVRDHHFDAVFEAYLNDDDVRAFLEKNNPAALAEIASRLREAQ